MAFLKEEIKAGVIIVSSIIILSAFVILIGGSRFFEKFDTYYVRVNNAAGLEEGSQVKLGGVRVGRIVSIKEPVSAGEPITIAIGVKKGVPLYKDTRALITQIGFVGDIYLLLTVNRSSSEKFKPGDVIPSDEQVQFTELMAKLDDISSSVDGLIKDVNKIFSSENIENLEKLIRNTDRAIVSGSSNFDKVATSLKKTTDKLAAVIEEVEALMKGNKDEVSNLIKKAREGVENAGNMIKAIEETAKSVNRTVDVQSRNFDVLIRTLSETTEDMNEVLQEIKNKPWSIIYKESAPRED